MLFIYIYIFLVPFLFQFLFPLSLSLSIYLFIYLFISLPRCSFIFKLIYLTHIFFFLLHIHIFNQTSYLFILSYPRLHLSLALPGAKDMFSYITLLPFLLVVCLCYCVFSRLSLSSLLPSSPNPYSPSPLASLFLLVWVFQESLRFCEWGSPSLLLDCNCVNDGRGGWSRLVGLLLNEDTFYPSIPCLSLFILSIYLLPHFPDFFRLHALEVWFCVSSIPFLLP